MIRLIARWLILQSKDCLMDAAWYFEYYQPGSIGWSKGILYFELGEIYNDLAGILVRRIDG